MPIVDARLNPEKTRISLFCRTSSLWNISGEVRTYDTTPIILQYMGDHSERVLNVEFWNCGLCMKDPEQGCEENTRSTCKPFYISNRIDNLEFRPFTEGARLAR
jgi:hypothetical protein